MLLDLRVRVMEKGTSNINFKLIGLKFKLEMKNRIQESPVQAEQVYREYIEFMNQLNISLPISFLFLLAADIVILADLLIQIAPDSKFIQDLSYLGVSNMLFQINKANDQLASVISGGVIFLLLTPLYAFLTILFMAKYASKEEKGALKQTFGNSLISASVRSYCLSFSYLFLPIFISYGSKILSLGATNQFLGIAIIVLSIINCILIQYHIFELGNSVSSSSSLVALNYPYHLVDDGLVIIGIAIINIASGLASQIAGLTVLCLRLLLVLFIPFFNDFYCKYYKGIAISSAIASFGLLISFFSLNEYYTIILIIILVGFLLQFKFKREVPIWEELQANEGDQQELLGIKKRLYEKNLFVRSFRELILLGRKNNSHRNLLQIEIMKSKCSTLQKLNRGGARVCSSKDVIKFQQNTIKFISNFLSACQMSVSILKFVQSKEPKKQILAKAVGNLVDLFAQNKKIIKTLFEINQYSNEAKFLLIKTFGQLYNDIAFMREAQKWTSDSMQIDGQKQLKDRLFNQKSAIIFVNILEQIGKVVRISKNIPSVLGYEPNNLLGLSINQIIPYSIKPFHDENLLQFVEGYSNKQSKKDKHIQFYAYNKDFHLQQVIIRYNWIMSDFNTFHIAGIIEKVESDTHIILTDQYGNLQGWTKKIGSEELNLDQMSITQRKNYNIMPLFPTLIKYMDSFGVLVRTLFFKNSKARDNNLVVMNTENRVEEIGMVQPKLLNAFKKILKQDQIVGGCYAQIEFTKINLCHNRVKMWKISIRQYERVQNISQLNGIIQKSILNAVPRTDKSLMSCKQVMPQSSEKQQLSIFSEENIINKKIDSNFSLETQKQNSFTFQQLVFGQFSVSKTSFQFSTSAVQRPVKKRVQKQDKHPTATLQAGFNPTLQKNINIFWYVLPVTLLFLVLYILNLVSVISAGQQFVTECNSVISRNQATTIYLKSIFNPNITYISRFANGSLLQNMEYLYSQSFNYKTFLGDTIVQNKYYLFNTQIPATLQRLISSPIVYSNSTVNIIPPTSADYYREMTANYLGVVSQFNLKFSDTLSVWQTTISSYRSSFFIRLVFLCFSTAAYALLLILLYIRERRHKQTLEAFFKFEREDLQRKIGLIGVLVREVQMQSAEINLLKEFSEVVKREEIVNIQFSLIKNMYENKIKFDHDQQTENGMQKKKYYVAMIILVLFLITQLIFLLLHSIISLNALSYYNNAPSDLDNAAKLIVYPNYLLADLYLPLDSKIKANYDGVVNQALAFPINSIPNLFSFLGNVPCQDCNFMYPVLSTNFKSFYSTFVQRVVDMKASNQLNNSVVQDMFFAADYVIQKIKPVLTISYSFLDTSLVAYAVSMVILCVAISLGTKSINTEIQKLQTFLRFFSQENIIKNKHMNRLFSNSA